MKDIRKKKVIRRIRGNEDWTKTVGERFRETLSTPREEVSQ